MGRKEDFRIDHAASPAVIVNHLGLLFPQPFSGAVCGCSDSRLSSRPADDLNREVIARHGGAMRRFEADVNFFSSLSDNVAAL
ncbi:hypothetical protein QA645_33655 [Bradyrhizobium sp. CIAT3101]|uniref:hypothetical protein n=1 Tax=Bradyrhizobium sp. CIAT3101 TaxID=439387 RepID=UPI0024B25F90|nr:hypothetical protein [Bradyrhizobium sp. CIAT3101]WFU79403.1 hypothetical protein QA645_33655 [Bradyrhizobium sp. CIAT3101]